MCPGIRGICESHTALVTSQRQKVGTHLLNGTLWLLSAQFVRPEPPLSLALAAAQHANMAGGLDPRPLGQAKPTFSGLRPPRFDSRQRVGQMTRGRDPPRDIAQAVFGRGFLFLENQAVGCLREQLRHGSRQAGLYRELFMQRDSLGVKPWRRFAEEAGVGDLDGFEACVALPADSFPRIARGREVGERTGVRGTPTVWINGTVTRTDLASLRKAVADARSQKPRPGKSSQ